MPKICIITSSRADYGLLRPTMERIKHSKNLDLQVIVTGSHLAKKHGNTIKFIREDGIPIHAEIDLHIDKQDKKEITNSAAIAIGKIGNALEILNPDAVLLLGDRYEILCAATAASLQTIPILHCHGGEITEGANDDMFRHAITKLSSFHFVSNSQHKKRVIQLGEHPSRVIVSGALGIESIKHLNFKLKPQLEKELGLTLISPIFLVTYHPETLSKMSPKKQIILVLDALKRFKDATIIITKANADLHGELINSTIENYISNKPNFHLFASLGQLNYFSLMKLCDVVIGNSSSGIIEAPSFNKSNIDIGNRQKGRATAKSNIPVALNTNSISAAIQKALKKKKKKVSNPYDKGAASLQIVKTLEKLKFEKLLPKTFYDMKS
jgi:GDP/UDP-N,N'-diacetylbacillosamine 2-epimerase (hydrolysing)